MFYYLPDRPENFHKNEEVESFIEDFNKKLKNIDKNLYEQFFTKTVENKGYEFVFRVFLEQLFNYVHESTSENENNIKLNEDIVNSIAFYQQSFRNVDDINEINGINPFSVKIKKGDKIISENKNSYDYMIEHINECKIVDNNIKMILDKQGKTATWLSKKTMIPKSTLSSIIYNTNTVSLENAFKISLVLRLSIEKIFKFRVLEK